MELLMLQTCSQRLISTYSIDLLTFNYGDHNLFITSICVLCL